MMDHQNNLTQTHQKLIKHQSFQQILSDGLIILSIVISILLIKNHVSKELLIPMMALSSSFGPTIALANLANNLNQVFPCARRILNLLDEEPLLKEITNKNTILNLPIEIKIYHFIIQIRSLKFYIKSIIHLNLVKPMVFLVKVAVVNQLY